QGPVPGTAPLGAGNQVKQLLAGKPSLTMGGTPNPPTPGTRHEIVTWSATRAGMLDTVALLDEEGPEAGGSAPTRGTFRWHDPQERGGKVRSASIPAPKGATWNSGLRFAAAVGGRAMFAVRSGAKLRLVRVKPSGGAEAIDAAADLLPAGEVVFG